MRSNCNAKLTCEDCQYWRICSERRGICASFRKKFQSEVKEKCMSLICLIAVCILFAFMLYAASAGTLKALLIGLIGMIPSGTAAVYISNNMITYEEEWSDE